MRIKIITIIFACLASLWTASTASAWSGTVISVHDGDTVTVAPGGDVATPIAIRLYGIDAPEMDQPGGVVAQAWFAERLPAGQTVEVVPYGTDKYGRAVGLLQSGGHTLNGQAVAAGHAWVYAAYCKAKFCRTWEKWQKKAKQKKLGLWNDAHPIKPSEWRKNIWEKKGEKILNHR